MQTASSQDKPRATFVDLSPCFVILYCYARLCSLLEWYESGKVVSGLIKSCVVYENQFQLIKLVCAIYNVHVLINFPPLGHKILK